MKKHFVWIAAASILPALFAGSASAQINRSLHCQSSITHSSISSEPCPELASSIGLTSSYDQLEALSQADFPIFARRMNFRSENRSLFLTGELMNLSSEPIYVSSATFAFSRRVDDLSETYATVEVPILQTIQPGESESVDGLIDIGLFETTTTRLVSVQVGVP